MKDRSWDVARAVLCSIKNPCADITENPNLGETLKQVQGDALYFENFLLCESLPFRSSDTSERRRVILNLVQNLCESTRR